MELNRDDRLMATLESLRPEPTPRFAAELDERAAAGFPRPKRAGTGLEAGWERLLTWFRSARPRQLALTGGAVATIAIVVATAIVSTGGTGGRAGGGEVEPAATGSSSGQQANPGGSEASIEAAAGAEESAPNAGAASSSVEGTASSGAATQRLAKPRGETGPYASEARHRFVERSAQLTLGTDPSEVGRAASRVLRTVHAYDGIVLNSSLRGGSEGEAGASFELLIPSARLSDALAAFSGIAEVRARQDSSNDITAPTVTTAELLQESHARIESLLNQLADAETEAEQLAVEAKLRAEHRHAANLKAQLTSLQRRANLSRVSLQIVSDDAPASGAGGGWDAGDALHDAGHLLSVAAGVVIVALAVLAPIAMIILLAWLAHRLWVRGRRERALG